MKSKRSTIRYVNIHKVKTHFSRYVAAVEAGEWIVICRNGVPVAQITSIDTQVECRKRRFGLAKGLGKVNPEFFEPFTDNELYR